MPTCFNASELNLVVFCAGRIVPNHLIINKEVSFHANLQALDKNAVHHNSEEMTVYPNWKELLKIRTKKARTTFINAIVNVLQTYSQIAKLILLQNIHLTKAPLGPNFNPQLLRQ